MSAPNLADEFVDEGVINVEPRENATGMDHLDDAIADGEELLVRMGNSPLPGLGSDPRKQYATWFLRVAHVLEPFPPWAIDALNRASATNRHILKLEDRLRTDLAALYEVRRRAGNQS